MGKQPNEQHELLKSIFFKKDLFTPGKAHTYLNITMWWLVLSTWLDLEPPDRHTSSYLPGISRDVELRRENHPECGQHHPLGWSLRLNIKIKTKWAEQSIYLSSWLSTRLHQELAKAARHTCEGFFLNDSFEIRISTLSAGHPFWWDGESLYKRTWKKPVWGFTCLPSLLLSKPSILLLRHSFSDIRAY